MKNKHIRIFIIILCFIPNILYADVLDDYMSVITNPSISDQEKRALTVLYEWRQGKRVNPVSLGANGEVEIIYGLTQPQILCAVLQVTDIQLEPGESVTSAHIGDSARWSVEPAVSPSPHGSITHLIIKPKDANLLTSLVVTTDKRTYHLQLKSHKEQYFPMVKFNYPQDILSKIKKIDTQTKAEQAIKTLDTGDYLGNLTFSYKIKGKAKFKPIRVYNDGIKTIIELPKEIESSNVPTLMLIEKDSKDPVIVNYRLQNNRFIVDAVFDKAILISGIGWHQKKITIERR